MTSILLAAAHWALPILFLCALVLMTLFCLVSPWAKKINWSIVDAAWILSSAVTLYFLATGIVYEQERNIGQNNFDSYREHVMRGRDQSNENLETFCLGASRRRAVVEAAEVSQFCQLNSKALDNLQSALANLAFNSAVSRIPWADQSPEQLGNSSGQDALILDVRWQRVRAEMIWLNDNYAALKRLQGSIRYLDSVRKARTFWLYAFCFIIALRLGKPIYEIGMRRR